MQIISEQLKICYVTFILQNISAKATRGLISKAEANMLAWQVMHYHHVSICDVMKILTQADVGFCATMFHCTQ